MTEATQFCWLVEAPGQHYLAARQLAGYRFYWTQNHDDALRFFSREQADMVMMSVRELAPKLFWFAENLTDARPVEHAWLDPEKDTANG